MGSHDKHLCKISMFLAGFIFFTPHRIAITCANHVVKRYHLPLGTVAMFVYRIHNLMELGSFAGTVVNTAIKLSTTTLNDKNKTMLKNCVSGVSIWLMFVWSIITCISFMAGGEYGYFGEFFWNIVMLVFIYGVYSNSAMGIEGLNAPFYIVGLPLFGVFTFVFHKLYKWLYYIYFWDEYDYILVLYQIWIMMILSFATSVVWTVARAMDDSDSQGCGGVEIDISQNHGTGASDTSYYVSGGEKIQVMNQPVSGGTWKCYKHSKSSGSFTLKKITHSDVLMRGGGLKDNMNMEIRQGGAIYVYYSDQTNINQPKVICISKDNPATPSNNTWYKAGTSANNWSKVSGALTTKDPTGLQDSDLNGAGAGTITPKGCNYVIKLDKRPAPTKTIKYRTKGAYVTVTQGSPAPGGYTAYEHRVSISGNNTIIFKHNGNKLTEVTESDISKIFVYYKGGTHDHNREFPLIFCVYKGTNVQTYYKRGQTWNKDDSLKDINPESPSGDDLNTLEKALEDLIDKYEVKLEKENEYKARPHPNTSGQITVSPLSQSGSYKGYKHTIPGSNQKINRITIHGYAIKGITELDDGSGFTGKQYVYVYFEKNDADGARQKPILICLSESGGTSGNTWYKRISATTWQVDSTYGNTHNPNTISGFADKLDAIKYAIQPYSGLAKLFGMGEDKDYHIIHWSPIFLVALSLGTVYAFYPAISPYQLVDDPFDGKKIELWIQAISATPHIAFAITQICEIGPGRLWKNYEHECNNEYLYAIYHATWLFFIPYIICIYIFFSMMHFPDGRIGKYFRASVFRTGVLCVVFAWVQEFMEAVGFGGGMGAQVSGKCGDTYNDDAGTIFGFMFLAFMIVSMFTEDLKLLLII